MTKKTHHEHRRMKETRKFNGHTLHYHSARETKADAEKTVKYLKKDHKYVRQTKMKHGRAIWVS